MSKSSRRGAQGLPARPETDPGRGCPPAPLTGRLFVGPDCVGPDCVGADVVV